MIKYEGGDWMQSMADRGMIEVAAPQPKAGVAGRLGLGALT